MFTPSTVQKAQTFVINRDGADFGDHPHLFGAPQGQAVVCWSTNGRIGVKGVLFADDFREPVEAIVRIRFRRSTGAWTGVTTQRVSGNGGVVAFRPVTVVSPRGQFDRVQIRLQKFQDTALQNDTVQDVGSYVFFR